MGLPFFMKKNIIIGALLLIIGFVIGVLCKPRRIERIVDIQRDTITKIDTHIVEKPVLKEKRVIDTVFVSIEVHDTTTINDTLYMRLEFETKTYKGENYLAKVSGYNPSLYYIEVYPKTTTITENVTRSIGPRKWHFSLDLGANVGRSGLPYITPNLGIEMGYGRWSLTGETGVDLKVSQNMMLQPSLYYELGFKYSLINKSN